MEMRNFDVEFTIRRFWPYVRPDAFNQTSLYLNNELVWPIEDLEDWEDPPVLPERGTKFRLEIPSGYLEGTIQDVVEVNDILEVWKIEGCVWEGKFAGLTTGSCGNGYFRYFATPNTKVKSSITPEELTYSEYAAVRRFAEAAARGGFGEPIWLGPAENQELLKSALRHLRTLRKEAERLAAE